MGQRGGPTCRVSGRNTLLEDGWCLSGSGSCQVDEGCGLLAPSAPPPSIAKTTKRQRWLLRSSGYVFSLLLRASCKAALANLPARRLGWPSRVRGETRVASTASWAPFQSGKPLAMTSVRRSSYWWRWLMLTSSTLGVCSDSGSGFHTDASSCSSSGPARLRRTLTGRRLHGARKGGPECDSTGRCRRSRGVVAVGGGEGSP